MSVKDPICGKDVDPLRARAVGIFGGVTYYFCSADCKARFKDPRRAPREPTRELSARPVKVVAEPPPPAAPPALAAGAEPAKIADGDDAEPPIKKDPSPSVMEELRAAQPGWGRVWIVIAVLLAAAAGVLFYLYRRG